MPKNLLLLASVLAAMTLAAAPARAQTSDRALLATFCDTGNIKGSTCKRAKNYPNAPRSGCDVTLGSNSYRGRFIPSANALMVLPYESGCEAHATDNGGAVVFEQINEKYVFRNFLPGVMTRDCIGTEKDA